MNAAELAECVLRSARIPAGRYRFEEASSECAVVRIHGDYCSGKLVVLIRPDSLVWIQVSGAGTLVKICIPVSTLDDFIDHIINAVDAVKDWEPVQIDWSLLAEELEDYAALELGAAH